MYRQGDVLLMPAGTTPDDLEEVPRESGRIVLAHGETTGHAHAIAAPTARLYRDPHEATARYLRIVGDQPVALAHEEHGPILLTPQTYRVVRQREYTPEGPRAVVD